MLRQLLVEKLFGDDARVTWEDEFFHVITPRNELLDLHLRGLEDVAFKEIDDL